MRSTFSTLMLSSLAARVITASREVASTTVAGGSRTGSTQAPNRAIVLHFNGTDGMGSGGSGTYDPSGSFYAPSNDLLISFHDLIISASAFGSAEIAILNGVDISKCSP